MARSSAIVALVALAVVLVGAQRETLHLHGSGTTNPSKFFWKIMSIMEERTTSPIHMTYRSVGSSKGQYEFLAAERDDIVSFNDFGSGDIPIKSADYSTLKTAGVDMLHIPFMLGAISFFHSVPSPDSDYADIKLNACLLSKIFQRQIKTWDDPAILALNPGLVVPTDQPITVVHRTSGSSSTALSLQYMRDVCTDVNFELEVGTTSNWATDTEAVIGSDGMASYLQTHPYAIGYLDSGHGQALGLSEVSIPNKDGYFVTSSTADIIATASQALNSLPGALDDWSAVSLLNLPGQSAWPIVTFSYIYLRKDLTYAGQTGALAKAFAKFVLHPEGQRHVSEFNFSPLPEDVIATITPAVDSIILADGVDDWTFEEEDNPLAEGAGQGERVFSSRRSTYELVQLEQLGNKFDTLSSTVDTLEGNMDSIETFLPQMHGSGTTNPSKYFWKLMELLKVRARVPLHITYRAVGSSTGQHEFIGKDNGYVGYNDFASGDIPMSQADHQELRDKAGEKGVMLHIPFMIGAISFFHSVPDEAAGFQTVKLDACLLSRIFQRQIKTWDHQEILDLNPELSVPAGQPITVVHRKLGSSSTSLATQYMSEVCTNVQFGPGVGATVTWPSDTEEVEGSGGMSTYLQTHPYAIGYIDSGHGHALGLSEVAIPNKSGKYVVSKDADIVSKVALPSVREDWSNVNLMNQDGDNTWPIVTFSYIYLRQDLTHLGETGALVKAFVQFVLSEEGQEYVYDFGFSPVSTTLRQTLRENLNVYLKLAPGVDEWSFETSTLKGAGAALRTFSAKRQDFSGVEVSELKGRLAQMETQMAALLALQRKENDSDDRPSPTAIVALLFSLLAVLLAVGNCFMWRRTGARMGSMAECMRPAQHGEDGKVGTPPHHLSPSPPRPMSERHHSGGGAPG